MPTSDKLLADLKLLHPKLIDLSLGRVERLLTKLGNPHLALPPVVHIAGTNGKGSVTAYLKAILEAAGHAVHVYTSPHLVRFHERIVIGKKGGIAQSIDEDRLVDVLTRTQALNDGDDITQFEITTAAAFLAFAENPADVLLLEVGLGGRLDATNVVPQPRLGIITPVSFDHADKLGDRLSLIAAEKAGILKPAMKTVVSRQEDEAMVVIANTAQRVGAPLIVWGQDFDAYQQAGRLVVQRHDRLLDLPMPALIGPHQVTNAGTAVVAALELDGFDIGETAIERGLQTVRWPARMQRLTAGPVTDLLQPGSELWLDGGHNPAAGAALAQTMADLEERAPRPLHLVVGMLGLKDAEGFLRHFKGLARHIVTVPIPGAHEQPFSPEALAEAATRAGLSAEPATSIPLALQTHESRFPGPKRILICGSLYLAGHVLALQDGVAAQPN
ncbi:MAG: bifunctional folylpolyglutamate synthase/dihydrofolate synthase [Hyphomicrobiaceae bacterium]|nr:bifunctional folylpolyglutamate synthase/dihydrofolate synthase [Hyphomicrobiaceae bacterium]MCC0006769.1 bifunctional folylpolyglutamate synthase/dihydrofolate synthase [Hyphomicrobiaceae bacterium]